MLEKLEIVLFDRADDEAPVRKPLHYQGCGLDNIYLVSGFHHAEKGGVLRSSVENVDDLHVLIALHLCTFRRPLTRREAVFLRKHVGITQAELARRMGIGRNAIQLWERGRNWRRPVQLLLQLTVLASITEHACNMFGTNAQHIQRWEHRLSEMTKWLLEVGEEWPNSMQPPGFIADAVIGNWKLGTPATETPPKNMVMV